MLAHKKVMLAVTTVVAVAAAPILAGCGSSTPAETSSSTSQVSTTSSATASPEAAGETTGAATESSTSDDATDTPAPGFTIDGSMTAGVVDQPPSSGFGADGSVVGLVPEIVQKALGNLGASDIDFTLATYANAIPGLQAKRWDLVASAVYVTPERCTQVDFSDPVEVDGVAYAVPKGNPQNLTSFADAAAAGITIGMISGAQIKEKAFAAGVQPNQITEYNDTQSLLDALKAERVNAVASASTAFASVTAADWWELTSLLPDGGISIGAVVFRPDDDDLREAFNAQLSGLKDAGEFDEISRSHGVDPAPVADVTTEAACAGEYA